MRILPFQAIVLTTGLTLTAGGSAFADDAKGKEEAGAEKPAKKLVERKFEKKDGDRPIDPEMILRRFDTNGDGKLDEAEAPERMAEGFARVDADGDGFVDAVELKVVVQRMGGRRAGGAPGAPEGVPSVDGIMQRMDKNGDGRIARGEAEKALAENFEKIDVDSDEILTREELKSGLEKIAAGRPGAAGGPGGNPFGEPGAFFARLDKNADGKIDRDEAPDRMKQMFDRIDGDADGAVSKDEFKEMAERMKARMKAGGGTPKDGQPKKSAD
ncbi:MAG: hypothetical protein ACRDD1_17725 [Planctomycetia bacterium]